MSDEAKLSLTQDQAEKILKRDIANLVRKVASGGNLSSSQRLLVQQAMETGNPAAKPWVTNQVELAEALGVDRKTIQRWLKVEGNPDRAADNRYNVAAWKQWARETGRKHFDSAEGEAGKGALEVRRLTVICERLEYEFKVQQGEYLHKNDVAEQTARAYAAVRRALLALPGTLAPLVSGEDVADAEAEIRRAVVEVLERLNTGEWDAPKDAEKEAAEDGDDGAN